MADKGRIMDTVFFIYDHNVLKKEEDDLKDAILFFSPSTYSIDERCALCGQLMGMSEFMSATICKSAPKVFRFEHDKYVFLHPGAYSLGLRGGAYTPDSVLQIQLNVLYETFVTYHGTIDSLKLRLKGTAGGFLQELDNIWRIILQASSILEGPSLAHTFQALPYVRLPKTGSHLFLQASHLLQSSQRRPYVLAGTILYKNRVLCTQLPPSLTRHLTYLHNQVPHIVRKTDCDLPMGCRIITVFLTDDELEDIDPLDTLGRRHCKVTDFSIKRESEVIKRQTTHTVHTSKPPKQLSRRLTCPNISSTMIKPPAPSVPQKALQSFIVNEKRKKLYQVEQQDSLRVDRSSWSIRKSPKMSLSHVPIVECRTAESHCESEGEGSMALTASQSHFGDNIKHVESPVEEMFQRVDAPSFCGNELSESDGESNERLTASDAPKMSKQNSTNSTDTLNDVDNGNNTGARETPEKEIPSGTQLDNQEVKPSNVKRAEPSNKTETSDESSIKHKEETGSMQKKDSTSTVGMGKLCTDLTNSTESLGQKDVISVSFKQSSNLTEQDSEAGENTVSSAADISDSKDSESNVLEPSVEEASDVKDSGVNETDVLDPSISDFEDSDNESPGKVDKQTKPESHQKEEKSYSVSIEESVKVGDRIAIGDSVHSSSSKVAFQEKIPPENKMLSSISSDDNTQVRFYDKMPNDKTETLKKDSNHAVYEHHVEVHADSSGNSVADNYSVTNSGSGNSGNNTESVGTDLSRKSDDRTEHSLTTVVDNKSFIDKNKLNDVDVSAPKVNIAQGEQNIHQVDAKMLTNVPGHSSKYESEVETEDESVAMGTVEPCINCLDLVAKQTDDTQPGSQAEVRCSKCAATMKQNMFGAAGDDREVIDFGDTLQDRHYESGAETDGGINVYNRSKPHTEKTDGSGSIISSLSSDISTDSTISQYWTHEMDELNDLTLYVQCHSDISLLLLMGNPDQYEENLFHSLWKGSLAHLADLDYYIKECMEVSDDDDEDTPCTASHGYTTGSYGYLKFDSYAAELKGTITDPGTDKKSQNLHQMLTTLHSEFQHDQCMSDITLRSNFNSCYGHSTLVEETYFQPELQQKLSSGFPIPRDPVFNLDIVAKQYLAKDKHLSMI